MSEYLTATQAAEKLGTSLTNVARWCRDGTLPATRLGIGRIWRIKAEDVEQFVLPARGPKPGAERKRLLEMAQDVVRLTGLAEGDPSENADALLSYQVQFDTFAIALAQQARCTRARARQALAKAIRLARGAKPECPYCKGTGVTDSGGFDAQGNPISIPCPYCDGAK